MNLLDNPAYLLPPLIAAAVIGLLVVLVLTRTRRKLNDWIFCAFLASMGLTNIFIFAMRYSPSAQQALFWEKLLIPATSASFVFYYHFTLIYTNAIKRTFLVPAYLYPLLATALAPTDLLVREMRIEYYGYAPVMGPLAAAMFLVTLFLIGGGVNNLARRYRHSTVFTERNRLLYLMVAALFPTLGSILDAFSNLPPMAIWGYIMFCVSCTVAILKYQLLDINFMIRRGSTYFLASTLLAAIYIVLVIIFSYLFKPLTIPVWLYIFIVAALALALQPAWRRLQRQVDKWFYRERYDFLSALEAFSRQTHRIGNLDSLAASLVALTKRALHASSACLMLDSGTGEFNTIASTKQDFQFTVKSSSPLLGWIQPNKKILRSHDLAVLPTLQFLPDAERNALNEIRAELFVPMMNPEGQVFGLLIVGEKLSDQPYSQEDERILSVVASRVAIELENARLYHLEKQTREKLEEQDKLKTEFLHSVAHEMKTPLTAIISSSELLGEEVLAIHPDIKKKLINNVKHSARTMDGRVNELLNFARMQVSEIELNREQLNMGLLLQEVISEIHILFEKRKQSLTLELADSVPPVKADRERIAQVLLNLLSNANKFSPFGSNIMVRLRQDNDKVRVEVEDSALPLSEKERGKIFTPYYRGQDVSKRQRLPGLGLGLTISKKMVELHQGEINVNSHPGKGNTFWFTLPVTRD